MLRRHKLKAAKNLSGGLGGPRERHGGVTVCPGRKRGAVDMGLADPHNHAGRAAEKEPAVQAGRGVRYQPPPSEPHVRDPHALASGRRRQRQRLRPGESLLSVTTDLLLYLFNSLCGQRSSRKRVGRWGKIASVWH